MPPPTHQSNQSTNQLISNNFFAYITYQLLSKLIQMKRSLLPLLFAFLIIPALAQRRPAAEVPPAAAADKPIVYNRMVNTDSSVTTRHEVTVKGTRIPYSATAGTMPIWD